MSLRQRISDALIRWLTQDRVPPSPIPMSDYERLCYEIRPGDVLLIEGRTRISDIIQSLTRSSWSHSALYIGRTFDIDDPALRERVQSACEHAENEQLVIEGLLGQGTVISPLSKYRLEHIRICRPQGLAKDDCNAVIAYAIEHLGREYDVRHIIDLMRLLFPLPFIPRRWRSSIFKLEKTDNKEICSSMIAEAFNAIRYPILPQLRKHEEKGFELVQRNPRLFTPSDFDYSPYFNIIKYPFFQLSEQALYRHLPWSEEDHPGTHTATPSSVSTKIAMKINAQQEQPIKPPKKPSKKRQKPDQVVNNKQKKD